MKKSTTISLVLITAALASCSQKKPFDPSQKEVYMRGDTTAPYGHTNHHHHSGGLWYYAFRPYGSYSGGSYHHSGYYSGAVSERANIGTSSAKSSVIRGGFGGSSHSFSVSS